MFRTLTRLLAVCLLALSPLWGVGSAAARPAGYPVWPSFLSTGCNSVSSSAGGTTTVCGQGGFLLTQVNSGYACNRLDIGISAFSSGPFIVTGTADSGSVENTITVNDTGDYTMDFPGFLVNNLIVIQMSAPDSGSMTVAYIQTIPCPVATATATVNPSSTATNTPVPVTGTATTIPTNTPLPSGHSTFTPTGTRTATPGPTNTITPTASSTPIPVGRACGIGVVFLNCNIPIAGGSPSYASNYWAQDPAYTGGTNPCTSSTGFGANAIDCNNSLITNQYFTATSNGYACVDITYITGGVANIYFDTGGGYALRSSVSSSGVICSSSTVTNGQSVGVGLSGNGTAFVLESVFESGTAPGAGTGTRNCGIGFDFFNCNMTGPNGQKDGYSTYSWAHNPAYTGGFQPCFDASANFGANEVDCDNSLITNQYFTSPQVGYPCVTISYNNGGDINIYYDMGSGLSLRATVSTSSVTCAATQASVGQSVGVGLSGNGTAFELVNVFLSTGNGTPLPTVASSTPTVTNTSTPTGTPTPGPTTPPATLTEQAKQTETAVASSFTPTPIPIPGAQETLIPTDTPCPGGCAVGQLTQVPGFATRVLVDTSPFSALEHLSLARSSCQPFGYVQIPVPVIHGTPALGSTTPLSFTWTAPVTHTWDDTNVFSNTALQPCAMVKEIPSFVWDFTYWLSVLMCAVGWFMWLIGFVGRLSGDETING